MTDLYPKESWNFVFGEASLKSHIGVFSFARYSSAFNKLKAVKLKPKDRSLLLKRSCQVMCHEITHMFGIGHCIYFDCCMNGANHLLESDAQPLHMCPVDLHKLESVLGFDIESRYLSLLEFYRQHKNSFNEEISWLQKRVDQISALKKSNRTSKKE